MNQLMLELAAKAYGVDVQGWFYEEEVLIFADISEDGDCVVEWNPLTRDGDALRLAVHLDMQITVNRVDGFTEVIAGYFGDVVVRELHGDDMFAATRLAIVKAAGVQDGK